VPEGDAGALARALTGLLQDGVRRRDLGRRAVEWARRFGWPCVARALTELYGELAPGLRAVPRSSRCTAPF
jgi:glycosyltransferase involved in cell wall biosynthesis